MKNGVFISELHDIGKLVDRQALDKLGIKISGHAFHDFDFSLIGISRPSSPNWYSQYLEDDNLKPPDKDLLNSSEATTLIPDPKVRADVLLTKIADGISASITRLELLGKHVQRGQIGEGVHKIWNPEFYQKQGKHWAAFADVSSLKRMLQYIDSCEDYKDFFRDFWDYLVLTPEDKKAPGNIVSLLAHLELVGKVYRILKKHSFLQFRDNQHSLIYNQQPIKSVREACGHIDPTQQAGKWIFRTVFCDIGFPQTFSRLQDLNVFKKRADIIRTFSESEDTKDYVLFFTEDFLCLFIPNEDELKIQDLLRPFIENGFTIDYKEMEAELNLLTSSMERAYRGFHSLASNRHLKLYYKRATLNLPEKLPSQLCDSCQIRQGKERIKEQTREWLCDTCYSIRAMGEPAREYAEWEDKGLKAAWMKITLNQVDLPEILHRLFDKYVDSFTAMLHVRSNDKTILKESFRPLAVQIDFVKDYKSLLQAFKKRVYEIKDDKGDSLFTKETFLYPIDGYDEFGIFKVHSSKTLLKVTDIFTGLLEEYFPECVEDSPIKFALSVAQVKYPYQEHWRFLSKPKDAFNIQSPTTRLTLSLRQYKTLRDKIGQENVRLSHFLNRLVQIQIETHSDMIVMLEVCDKNNKQKFPAILELLEDGLTPQQILNYYKLIHEEDTHE